MDKDFIRISDKTIEVKNLTCEPLTCESLLETPTVKLKNIQSSSFEITDKEKINRLHDFLSETEKRFAENLPELIVKRFYESHRDWFEDMPYPVAREYILTYFDFSNIEVGYDNIVVYPEWKPVEVLLSEDVDTPLLDKWLNKQYEKKRE